MSLGPLLLGVQGIELQEEEREMLMHPLTGGVVLFSRNYESLEQLEALTAQIHQLREPRLLIAVDHEGGRVQRFRADFTPLPAAGRIGAEYDAHPHKARQLAEAAGWLMAAELLAAGVDLSFMPVLDLDRGVCPVIGDRAFHRAPEAVADLAHHYLVGMGRAGMAGTGKHFPGHGAVTADSHTDLPVDPRPFNELLMEDLVPFERMTAFGLHAVMSAHVRYDQIDGSIATYSTFWLQDVLRARLGFQGLIFSDDLEMAAAATAGDVPDRVRRALRAGCDVALVCQTRVAMAAVLDAGLEWHNPVTQLRLARMHGHGGGGHRHLHQDPQWRAAVKCLMALDEPHTLDLI
ncbi:MAG TPA: beta-N-acetylhexosaminidase [Chromatiales bacterium]|nr:beta-N-acetylhexosaminidase [Chromatiales bacterium]